MVWLVVGVDASIICIVVLCLDQSFCDVEVKLCTLIRVVSFSAKDIGSINKSMRMTL